MVEFIEIDVKTKAGASRKINDYLKTGKSVLSVFNNAKSDHVYFTEVRQYFIEICRKLHSENMVLLYFSPVQIGTEYKEGPVYSNPIEFYQTWKTYGDKYTDEQFESLAINSKAYIDAFNNSISNKIYKWENYSADLTFNTFGYFPGNIFISRLSLDGVRENLAINGRVLFKALNLLPKKFFSDKNAGEVIYRAISEYIVDVDWSTIPDEIFLLYWKSIKNSENAEKRAERRRQKYKKKKEELVQRRKNLKDLGNRLEIQYAELMIDSQIRVDLE